MSKRGGREGSLRRGRKDRYERARVSRDRWEGREGRGRIGWMDERRRGEIVRKEQ